jgi:hypothetical protein
LRQSLSAPFRWRRDGVPTGQTPSAIGLFPTGGRRHVAVGKARTVSVADPIQGRDDFGRKAAGFGDNRIDIADAELTEQALLNRGLKRRGVFKR